MTTEALLRATKRALLDCHSDSGDEGWVSVSDLLQRLGLGVSTDSLRGALSCMAMDGKIEFRDNPQDLRERQYRIHPDEVVGLRRGIELLDDPRAEWKTLPSAA